MVAFTHIYLLIYLTNPLSFVVFALCSFSSAPLQFLAWIIHLQRSPSSAPRHNTITFSTSQTFSKICRKWHRKILKMFRVHKWTKSSWSWKDWSLVPQIQPSHLFHDSTVYAAFTLMCHSSKQAASHISSINYLILLQTMQKNDRQPQKWFIYISKG